MGTYPHYIRIGWAGLKAGAPEDDSVARFTHYFEEIRLYGQYHISQVVGLQCRRAKEK